MRMNCLKGWKDKRHLKEVAGLGIPFLNAFIWERNESQKTEQTDSHISMFLFD